MTDSPHADVWPLRTERLLIRPMTEVDVDAMWKWRRLPEVNRWLGLAPATIEEFRERYRDPARLGSMHIVELVAESGEATPVGDIMIRLGDGWAQLEVADQAKGVEAELGWVLDPAHTGRGYATEAIRAVIDVCFGPWGLRRVHAGCFADNEPSWRLMERLGMRREEFSRKTALHRSGQWLDGMNYGILTEEWASTGHGSVTPSTTNV
ncbi:GNAT family protein [Microbacterium sp. NPDC089320]|uniref:GNAT family N-acetyltransferase n=1 Tax=Microbacterium sp. NPDC089320 TaxID=3155182 RepID=UPI0034478E98